jgi:hypothetical protein
MADDRDKNGNGEEHQERPERRNSPPAALRMWNREYPITVKNVLLVFALISAVGSGVGWFLNRFIFPWPTRDEVAESIAVTNATVGTVREEHLKTREDIAEMREDIAEMRGDARLTAQAICAMTRKFAPENTPPGCAPIPRSRRDTTGINGGNSITLERAQP